MKARWPLSIVLFLVIAVAGTPVLAGYYGHRYHFRPHFRPHHYHPHYYHGGDLFFGALVGFTLGALLTPPPPRPVYVYRAYPPPVVYREYVVVPAPARVYRETRIYREPVADAGVRTARNASCLQTREYTTTIVIEGKTVDAYGTKCLQPDGSWAYGPATPVPKF